VEQGFNETYYATVAQVIPILLVAAVATRIWSEHKGVPVERNLISIAVVMFALAGEYVAIAALSAREAPDHYENVAVAVSLMLSGSLIVFNLLAEPLHAIASRLPERWHDASWNVLVTAYFAVAAAVIYFRPPATVVITAAAFVVVLGLVLLGFWRDTEGWISRRRRSRED
jgi:hypothetical protein